MSPILVRPVREQLEHDRVIRLLQAKYKRKFDVGINPGNEQSAPVGQGPSAWYPDLVLQSTERSRKLLGVVEVETVESINHLEAMSQWVAFGKLKAPFHLYVPATMVDVAKRFCLDLQIPVAEIWAYHSLGEQIRFTIVQRAPGVEDSQAVTREPRRPKAAAAAAPRPSRSRVAKSGAAKVVAAKAVAAKAVAKPARRVVPPARKKTARGAKSSKPVSRSAAKKTVTRASKRK